MAEDFCNNCGHRNPLEANFCSACGAALGHHADLTLTITSVDAAGEVHEPDVVVHLEHFDEGPGVLVVKRGSEAGTTFELGKELTSAGRAPDADIFLDDVTVSRRHAEIVRQADRYLLRDVGSLNGTYLNRERIVEASLHNGDEVQIGKFRLVFLSGRGGD